MKFSEIIKEAKKIRTAKDFEVYIWIKGIPKVVRVDKVTTGSKGSMGTVLVLEGEEK